MKSQKILPPLIMIYATLSNLKSNEHKSAISLILTGSFSTLSIKTSAMFLQLLAMLLQMQFHTFEKRALLNSGAISKYFILFPIDGQRFLQSVFGFQLHCFDFIFGGVKRPIYYRTQYILSLYSTTAKKKRFKSVVLVIVLGHPSLALNS